ncbi:MAG: DUF5687 family protein [bacterium]
MLTFIFSHNLKKTVRSILWHRELASKIFMTIVLLLLALNLLSLGVFIDEVLNITAKDMNPVEVINGVLIYYFLFDFLLRIFFQKVPGMIIQPYLLMPISRKSLLRFLLFKTLLSPFNYFPLLVLIPVAIKVIGASYDTGGTLIWLIAIMSIVISSNFIFFLIQKLQMAKSRTVLIAIFIITAFIALDKLNIFNITVLSGNIFQALLENRGLIIIPVLVAMISYRFNFKFLQKYFYLDNYSDQRKSTSGTSNIYSFFEKFGEIGNYLSLELKLLLRNKRSRSSLMMTIMVIFIVPIYYLTIQEEINPYPKPDKEVIAAIKSQIPEEHECAVTFRVEANNLPKDAHVFVTGDNAVFGPWQPDVFPMVQQPDKSWQRTFLFPKNVNVEFIFTLGTWQNEMKMGDGVSPQKGYFTANSDTTIVYKNPNWGIPRRSTFFDVFLIYMGLLFTGFLILVYGQFIYSWESSYFDFIMSVPVNIYKYIYSKWVLMLIFGTALYLISMATYFISPQIFFINTLLFIYNIGVNSFIIIFWAALSRKRFDLNESILSTQGKGGTQFSTILPTFILPILIYLPFAFTGKHEYGFYFFGILGFTGFIFHRYFLKLAVKYFHSQRYKMAAGFRQK